VNNKSIIILGDSTSMTVGVEKASYLFLLSSMKIWPSNTKIINCSMPGFTSTDACAFFFNNIDSFGGIKSVIIYLGNCDTMSSELNKGKYTFKRQIQSKLSLIFKKKYKKVKLKNRLTYMEWDSNFDGEIESPVSVTDFSYNISRIVKFCNNKNISVVLVNPIAHKNFPSGTGKGNFIFYNYMDISDDMSEQLIVPDKRFAEALRCYRDGDFLEASRLYKDILANTSELSENLEYQTIIVNNYAICMAKCGNYSEAEQLLNLMLKERGCRREIILYNLAVLAKVQGDTHLYSKLLTESYESDKSMYRIRQLYKNAIDAISNEYKSVRTINMADFIDDHDFVDHCHLLPSAQKKFANVLKDLLSHPELQGNSNMEISNFLYNPEYGLGDNQTFNEYFRVHSSIPESKIKEAFLSILEGVKSSGADYVIPDDLPTDIKYAIEYYQRHPCFKRLYDIAVAEPKYQTDVGRFPELFLTRYIIPYVKEIENKAKLNELFSIELKLLRNSDDLINLLPNRIKVLGFVSPPEIENSYASEWCDLIITNVCNELRKHLEKKNQIGNRLKSTIYWYFRETLRFGSHSRVSMRYERLILEYTTEALAVAVVLKHSDDKKIKVISKLITLVEDVTNVHEDYCSNYNPDVDNAELLEIYDSQLGHQLKALFNIISDNSIQL